VSVPDIDCFGGKEWTYDEEEDDGGSVKDGSNTKYRARTHTASAFSKARSARRYIGGAAVPSDHLPAGIMRTSIGSGFP
jgi:hypothetical protein